jgi:hypothetical protein
VKVNNYVRKIEEHYWHKDEMMEESIRNINMNIRIENSGDESEDDVSARS